MRTLRFDPAVLDGNFGGGDIASDDLRRIAEVAMTMPADVYDPAIHGDAEVAADAKHQQELERIVAANPVNIDGPAFEQEALRRKQHLEAHHKMRALAVGEVPDDFVPAPETHDPAPKAATGFAVASKRQRMSRGDQERGRRLLALAADVRAAVKNKAAASEIGALLRRAKDTLGHGGFLPWLERQDFPFSVRTAQNYIASAA